MRGIIGTHAWEIVVSLYEGEERGQKGKCQRSDVRGWIGRKGNGLGIQSGGSSWAKKMVVLRTEIGAV